MGCGFHFLGNGANATWAPLATIFCGAISSTSAGFLTLRTPVIGSELKRVICAARYDALTEIHNRHAATTILNQLDESDESQYALVLIDIDKFKTINDTHGHEFGDRVICQAAQIVSGSLRRQSDIVARWGGDELLVILHGCCSVDVALSFAQELIYRARQTEVFTFSAGVAVSAKGEKSDKVFSRVDHLLYSAKNEGRDRAVAE